MFEKFRQNTKAIAKEKGLTYAQIAECAGIEESTIKGFMCGANDSRRVAEKIADALGKSMLYENGCYVLKSKDDEAFQTTERRIIMPEVFNEMTIDSVNGTELKSRIMKGADELYAEKNVKDAASLYKIAAQLDENRTYRRETVCKYY